MRRSILPIIAVLLLTAGMLALPISAAAASAEQVERSVTWKYDFPTYAAPVSVKLDGKSVLEGEAAIINSVTYIPLRSFSELCGADSIVWNEKTRTATVKKAGTVIKVSDKLPYIEASGRYFYLSEPIRNISDRLFLPIRPLCKAFCVDVDWDNASRTVKLTSTNKTLVSGGSYYDQNDVYWLSRIINAEAGGEVLLGKIAVGNVVINRKNSSMYPNTIYGVIFDRKNGTQFSPVSMGTIYNTPNSQSIIAAKICLEGYSIDNKILFFMNPKLATNNWISQNRKFAFKIGNHYFFY